MMAVVVERMQDKPIILATFTGHITAEDFRKMYDESHALIADGETVYRVDDMTTITSSVNDVLESVEEVRKGGTGSTSDPRIKPVLVGQNRWTLNAQNIVKSLEAMEIPIFTTMDEALAYVHEQLG
jgi:hypothetical protein